jgi:hypothetical protein
MNFFDTFTVADADRIAWGRLVKDWAKGAALRPTDLDELRAQCDSRGISIEVSARMSAVAFVQHDKSVLIVGLPAPDMVEIGERSVAAYSGYPVPSFYERFFCGATPNQDLSPDEKLDLHAARIGEYAVNHCG